MGLRRVLQRFILFILSIIFWFKPHLKRHWIEFLKDLRRQRHGPPKFDFHYFETSNPSDSDSDLDDDDVVLLEMRERYFCRSKKCMDMGDSHKPTEKEFSEAAPVSVAFEVDSTPVRVPEPLVFAVVEETLPEFETVDDIEEVQPLSLDHVEIPPVCCWPKAVVVSRIVAVKEAAEMCILDATGDVDAAKQKTSPFPDCSYLNRGVTAVFLGMLLLQVFQVITSAGALLEAFQASRRPPRCALRVEDVDCVTGFSRPVVDEAPEVLQYCASDCGSIFAKVADTLRVSSVTEKNPSDIDPMEEIKEVDPEEQDIAVVLPACIGEAVEARCSDIDDGAAEALMQKEGSCFYPAGVSPKAAAFVLLALPSRVFQIIESASLLLQVVRRKAWSLSHPLVRELYILLCALWLARAGIG